MSDRLLRLRRWRRVFAWTMWVSLLLLMISVIRAMSFTKAASAIQMDSTLVVGCAAALAFLVALAGIVATGLMLRGERRRIVPSLGPESDSS